MKCRTRATIAGLIMACAGQSAWAQAAGDPSLPPTQAIDHAAVERIFGTWDGLQTDMVSRGINVQLNAVSEFAGNVSGGVKQGSTFANQVGLDLDINWERLAGVTGFSTHLILVNRSGSSDSALFGDHLLPVQEVYGSGGDAGVHFVSFYGEETILNGKFDFAAGRMNVENDFASSSLYCSYMNNDLCGDPKALPGGDIGHSAFPDAVWAARIQIKPIQATYIKFGVYAVNQGLYTNKYYRSGFDFNTSQDSGVYLPMELGWTPKLGVDALPGHYKLGAGYDTSSGYKDFANALAADGVPGYTNHFRRGSTQAWALADQMVWRHGKGDTNGVILLGGVVANNPNNTAYADEYFGGVVDGGFWRARPQDTIALLYTFVTVSSHLGDVEAVEASLDLPNSNGATGVQTHEQVFEANYKFHISRGLSVQPDFQYVFQPNAQANIKDAAVFGMRASAEF
jgi:porin